MPRALAILTISLLALGLPGRAALAQTYDCAGLQAKIADLDRGAARPARGSGPTRQQMADLGQMIATARGLGCDRPEIAFSGGAGGRCPGLNARISQMQAAIDSLQAASGPADRAAARADLVARFNAYCRNQPQAPPRQRGFFEQLFGIPGPSETAPPAQQEPSEEVPQETDREGNAHGGSQAVCVRTCDGGYFPLSISARGADPAFLTSLCQALCPNATVSVYTRVPYTQIDTAISLDSGAPYSEMPNALKFEKSFDAACTCKPPEQSWVEALAGADRLLGGERKTDILVTPEKSVELSQPKAESRAAGPDSAAPAASPAAAPSRSGAAPNQNPGATREVVGPDGVKRRVRIVGPTL
ncbi:MAG: DUF2865 domain-containing protein [Methylocella sp.]